VKKRSCLIKLDDGKEYRISWDDKEAIAYKRKKDIEGNGYWSKETYLADYGMQIHSTKDRLILHLLNVLMAYKAQE
jgi:hypothetical protein